MKTSVRPESTYKSGKVVQTSGTTSISIINLAHSLKLKVVAKGVETDEQSRLLRLLDCDEMQGFLFSKPVSGDAFEAAFLSPTSEAAGA